MAQILPSIFGADILQLKEEMLFLEQEASDILHIDMMDGNFVSHIAFGANQIAAMKKSSNMIFDVHMMVSQPKDHLDAVLATGAEMISIHYESTPHIHHLIQRIKRAGRKAGVVLNPGTPEAVISYLLADIDYVLLMTVNPGTPGQSFIDTSLLKIRNLKRMIGSRPIQIEVDGGIDDVTSRLVKEAGADFIVVGGYLFGKDKKESYQKLRAAIK